MSTTESIARELLVAEARNLHAIQCSAKTMIETLLARLDDYPDLADRLRAHIEDKDDEMANLERVLRQAGDDASLAATGATTGALTAVLKDDVLKTGMATYGLAHYEIAAYENLMGLAQDAGLHEAVPLLKRCLDVEKEMADWLHHHLGPTRRRYLALRSQRSASPGEADVARSNP